MKKAILFISLVVCSKAAGQEFFFQQQASLNEARMLEDAYRQGTRLIERRDYERAVAQFNTVLEKSSARADGALYWKAYALNKLGRRDQATSALAQLEKNFPQSRWLNDARALAVEVKQAAGQPVSPASESDEELKMVAIHGLMQTDPERALPLLEKVLANPKSSPKMREQALFVIAQQGGPKSRDALVRIAKGGANPDLQYKAVEFLGMFGKGNAQALADIYSSTQDLGVKKAVLRGFMMAGDSANLLAMAKSEKNAELRREAIHMLGITGKDKSGDALVSLYNSEQDVKVKTAIIEGLFIQQNASAMIGLARKEPDANTKRQIIERLAHMNSKEAQDYMMEILNK